MGAVRCDKMQRSDGSWGAKIRNSTWQEGVSQIFLLRLTINNLGLHPCLIFASSSPQPTKWGQIAQWVSSLEQQQLVIQPWTWLYWLWHWGSENNDEENHCLNMRDKALEQAHNNQWENLHNHILETFYKCQQMTAGVAFKAKRFSWLMEECNWGKAQ